MEKTAVNKPSRAEKEAYFEAPSSFTATIKRTQIKDNANPIQANEMTKEGLPTIDGLDSLKSSFIAWSIAEREGREKENVSLSALIFKKGSDKPIVARTNPLNSITHSKSV